MKIMYAFRTKIRVLLLAIGLPLAVGAQESLSPAALVSRALAKSYDLANARLAIASDQETRLAIRDTYVPHLEANGKYAFMTGDVLVDLPTTSLPLLDIPLFEGNRTFDSRGNLYTADVTASAVLFSGLQVPNLERAVGEKIRAQESMLIRQRQEIITEVVTAYDQLALLQQVKRTLDESRRRLAAEKETAEKAFEYGLITAFELSKIAVAESTIDAKQTEYEGKYRLLLQQLNRLTDVPEDSLALIDRPLRPYLLPQPDTRTVDRPELSALDAAVSANRYRLQAARAHGIPQVKALARVGYYGLSDGVLKTPYAHPSNGQPVRLHIDRLQAFPSFMVGVGFHWNIFDGMQSKRQVSKARIAVQQAENDRRKAEELIQLDVEKSAAEYHLANKQLAVGEQRLETVRKALAIAQKEFRVGLIKPAERIGAETDFQQAALAYYQGVFNQRRAAYQFLMATGRLDIDQLN